MKCILSLMIFIIGSCLGSFYGCMGYRIPNKINTIKPGSFCANCKKPLKWYMNIPLFSYIFLKGKCYYCKSKIGIDYFLIELFTGLAFMILYLIFGISREFFISIVLISILSVTLISDMKYYYISDRVIFVGFLFIILINFIYLKSDYNILSHLINSIIMFSIMFLIKIIGDKVFKKESLGGGDIKLIFIIGLSLGNIFESFISLFISSILALISSLIICKNKKDIIPFGPFLIIGNIIVYILSCYYQIELII